MPYRYATTRQDYTDFSSGRVFYSQPGCPAFPLRLASEIFQRCAAVLEAEGRLGPYVLYDPCCGGAYHLGTLGYLHYAQVAAMIGSDVDVEALALAARNLGLLTLEGLDTRIAELRTLYDLYGKSSHAAALESADRLRQQLAELSVTHHRVKTRVFRADATDAPALRKNLEEVSVDIVVADVPYGQHATWQTVNGKALPARDAGRVARPPLGQMLDALASCICPHTVVAIAADKAQKIAHEHYQRLQRFRMGKRQIALLKLTEQHKE